jgi:hypothetical protein
MLDAAADQPLGADRQQLRQEVALGVKIDEMKKAGLVGAADPRRPIALAGQMRVDPDPQRRDRPGRRLAHLRCEAAVDQAARQVPQEVDDRRSDQPLDQDAETRSDAG